MLQRAARDARLRLDGVRLSLLLVTRPLGEKQAKLWREYELDLQRANQSRLPKIAVGQWQPD